MSTVRTVPWDACGLSRRAFMAVGAAAIGASAVTADLVGQSPAGATDRPVRDRGPGGYPRIAGIFIGGPRHYEKANIQVQLARHDLIVLGFWRGWSHDGKTIPQVVDEIRSHNTEILIGQYTELLEMTSSATDASKMDIYEKLTAEHGPGGVGDWWARDSDGNHVSFASGQWTTNYTEFVQPDAEGDRYPQWLAKRNDAVFFRPPGESGDGRAAVAPVFDIWYSDSVHYRPRVDADWDGDGVNDLRDAPEVGAETRRGYAAYWDQINDLLPGALIMGNADGDSRNRRGYLSDAEYRRKIPAALKEGAMGKSWSDETQGSWDDMMWSYRSLIDNTIAPHAVVMNVWGSSTDYAFMRYALGSTMLENGYLSYTNGGYGEDTIVWFDEFDLDLGRPFEAPQRAPWKDGLYRRHFEHGMVLVNPKGNGQRTVPIEAGYRKFRGVQDPVTNDGQAVSAITLDERDGIVLIRG